MSSSPKLGKLAEFHSEMMKKKKGVISVFYCKSLKSDFSGSDKAERTIYGVLKKFALFEISNLLFSLTLISWSIKFSI